jgi:hypothetical protein
MARVPIIQNAIEILDMSKRTDSLFQMAQNLPINSSAITIAPAVLAIIKVFAALAIAGILMVPALAFDVRPDPNSTEGEADLTLKVGDEAGCSST